MEVGPFAIQKKYQRDMSRITNSSSKYVVL